MDEKKPASLSGQISSPVKYDPKGPQNGILSAEAIEKMEKTKTKLDEFKKKVIKKFPFTLSLSIIPAQMSKIFEEDEGLMKEEIERKPLHLMMVIPEEKFKEIPKKIKPEVLKIIKECKQEIWIHIKTPVDVWNYGLDSKYEFLDAIGASFPLHDKGFLGSIRVANIHKTLVLRKFEKYVATYGVFGSLVTGNADKDSDVDTVVIIDDTDVKRMPRLQLLERLRGMIYDYIREATALAGVKNVLNVQVWLLTDFWERVKDSEAVAFTFLRDGVPMHDRGTFLPWKLLLQMGKIKPSPEAVDKFMKLGEQSEAIVSRRLMDAMVDIYWGVVTPIQALIMLTGHAPPTPKKMLQESKEVLVDKEKVMTVSDLKTLEVAVKYFKDYEHGKLKKISGKQIDAFLKDSIVFDKKLKEVRKKLEGRLVQHDAERIEKDTFDLLKSIFGAKSKEALIKDFEKELVKKGKMQGKFVQVLKDISDFKQKAKSGKASAIYISNIKRNSVQLISELIDYVQRKDIVSAEKGIMQIKFNSGKNKGELVLTDSGAFFVEGGRIMSISGGRFKTSDRKEFEKAIKKSRDLGKYSLNSDVLTTLDKELGDFEISI